MFVTEMSGFHSIMMQMERVEMMAATITTAGIVGLKVSFPIPLSSKFYGKTVFSSVIQL